jgi:hypothetical protein
MESDEGIRVAVLSPQEEGRGGGKLEYATDILPFMAITFCGICNQINYGPQILLAFFFFF